MIYVIRGTHLSGPAGADLQALHDAMPSDDRPRSCGKKYGEGVHEGIVYEVLCSDEQLCVPCHQRATTDPFVMHLIAKHGFKTDLSADESLVRF